MTKKSYGDCFNSNCDYLEFSFSLSYQFHDDVTCVGVCSKQTCCPTSGEHDLMPEHYRTSL